MSVTRCSLETLEPADLARLREAVVRERVPAQGTMDLTRRCNLACLHCYHGGVGRDPGAGAELDAGAWKGIIDQAAEAGCLNLLITGGEPLLREDFAEIYAHARERGLIVTVFTNGTLVHRRALEVFREYPPLAVEVSLYGATAPTAEAVTRVPGSHQRCLEGVAALLGAGVRVKLKTVLMTLNRHELADMERLAAGFGVDFRFDPGVFPRLDGDRTPVGLRVAPREAAAADFAEPMRAGRWLEHFEKMKTQPPMEELFTCGAGVTSFHLTHDGQLTPCLLMRRPACDLKASSFLEGWRGAITEIRKMRPGPGYRCNSCDRRSLCNLCPAFFSLENGAPDRRSGFLCDIGEERYIFMRKLAPSGGDDDA